ncbi:glucans biosynthesis glucosyltransferase MdoH [Acuticoccus sp. I52.16.1]|nr:glucans biosynthesis glucosyltransferase MdoH [Acuticoccus sp. I52.16.1]UOM35808.1 glucans biosynthesis glucosyltransferase MdoH [Acuticoccus sp. I52.16.1]
MNLERRLLGRRIVFTLLNVVTVAGLAGAMLALLAGDGIGLGEGLMWGAYVVTLPWLSIGFWNAVIGTWLLVRGPRADDPLALDEAAGSAITTRTAIVMTLRNEAPAEAIGRLRLMFDELDAAGEADHFHVHVLSDTDDPAIAAAEADEIAHWRHENARAGRIHYRRRSDNRGFKAGNVEDFCATHAAEYDFFLTLDADSYLAARVVLRLVRTMQAAAHIGILQTLAIGTPSTSMFTRTFQFGMRHGMRAYTAGSVWWTGDCGPYWGHNALIRMAPFAAHCRLPKLAGSGPLGGHIMSHDQVEAVLMRRAGYHVRVIAEESESWEENPPTLPDFIRRELRWCQGNFQYFQLLAMPGLKAISRVQLALAIVMYLGAPAWMMFILLGAVAVAVHGAAVPAGWGLALVGVILFMCFAPKIMGLVAVVASPVQSRRYGGRLRAAAGGAFELTASMLMAPAVAFAVAVFAFALIFGRRVAWGAQPRAVRSVTWGEAVRTFLPQTVFGLALGVLIAALAPDILWLAAPVIAGLVLAIPFAVLTADPSLGRLMTRAGLCAIPEEAVMPPALARLRQIGGGRGGAEATRAAA